MTIARSDVKLMSSERLTDNEDGGGRMTSAEVQDGVANNLFPDISRLDRVYGRVSMRKAFLSVNTANRDTYYGAHAIVSNPPADDSVHTLLFTTKSPSDERADAQGKVENYLAKSYKTSLHLLGDHLSGQLSLTCFQDLKAELPSIGDVLVLVGADIEQYVRIVDMKVKEVVFPYDTGNGVGNFNAAKITLDINQPLTYDFTGNEPHPTASPITSLYTCRIANASKYYGVDVLEEAAHVGQKVVKCTGIFKPIVPATNKENVILDSYPFIDDENMMAIGEANSFTKSLGASVNSGKTFYIGMGVLPGTLKILYGSTYYKDRGGAIVPSNPVNDIGVTGSISYSTGVVFLQGGGSGLNVSVVCTPAANISGEKITDFKEITSANIAFNHVFDIVSSTGQLPAKGTVVADYLSFGKWYRLYDNGNGGLEGKVSGVGAGTVDYTTGSVSVTCAALPDIGSYIIISFAPSGGACQLSVPGYTFKGQPIAIPELLAQPGTVQLSWKTKAGATVTVTDNGQGAFSNANATGTMCYSRLKYNSQGQDEIIGHNGLITPTVPPDTTVPITVTYNEGLALNFSSGNVSEPDKTGLNQSIAFNLGKTGIIPGTVYLAVKIRRPLNEAYGWESNNFYETWGTVRDDGSGNLSLYGTYWWFGSFYHAYSAPRAITGQVNYATGDITFNLYSASIPLYRYAQAGQTWGRETSFGVESFGGELFYHCAVIGSAGAAHTITVPWDAPKFIFSQAARDLIPTSLRFRVNITDIQDVIGGKLVTGINTSTGVGTQVGTVDYDSGEVTLNDFSLFANTGAIALTGTSILTKDDLHYPVKQAIFRTAGSPLVPGSVTLRGYNFNTAASLNLEIDNEGNITSPVDATLTGKISFDTGVVEILCGASSLFGPQLSYNAVYLQNVPLDSQLLGLDPTKLPLDGRVPIFRKADVIVVHHTGTYQCAEPAASNTFAVGRTRLALVEVFDANDLRLPDAKYSYDLDLGTVTFVADLTGFTEPLRILHRIEDMLLATEVYINGKIETAGALSHEFPLGTTQVSSALLFGDLASRIYDLFSQAVWTAVWSDARIGSNTTGQFNDLQYPVTVTNEEAIEERWAIIFTSANNFTVNGETLGQIGTGNTGANCAPLNGLTGKPYFTIDYRGWGTGWATGNVLRFNTKAASAPMWIIRTTVAGPVEEPVDKFILQLRGDAN